MKVHPASCDLLAFGLDAVSGECTEVVGRTFCILAVGETNGRLFSSLILKFEADTPYAP